ncbi:hypothetical protein T265_03152 [Opisthorchis viverrini]|uniref:NADH dehydrogenase [ubiquinone] 1 beta subcomplex subunit 11, mitochondrial n=2 Tax=Opisthorchis viverrini TaxID=6198 RepID=A0A075AHT0_OPIVI|nr:hypothetical protein T265_03152 [Opisthorchis viverrini]KER30419.1 hypothetical protein T265_03152 [Opisthorchis viverrini]
MGSWRVSWVRRLPMLSELILCAARRSGGRFIPQRQWIHISSVFSRPEMPQLPHILKQNQIPEADRRRIEQEVQEMTKDWVPHGMHETDKNEDIYRFKFLTFMSYSVFTAGVFLLLWYTPDRGQEEWCRREAYLELERRRRDGLPLIIPDLVPPERVKLPSDEELGPDFKIII